MTPKEKAIEFVAKFEPYCYHERIECALMVLDELIYFSSNQLLSVDFDENYYCDEDFFIAVKQEIKALLWTYHQTI
jgi:hypothetical protein